MEITEQERIILETGGWELMGHTSAANGHWPDVDDHMEALRGNGDFDFMLRARLEGLPVGYYSVWRKRK